MERIKQYVQEQGFPRPRFKYVYFIVPELENSLCIGAQVSTVTSFYWMDSFKFFPEKQTFVFLD